MLASGSRPIEWEHLPLPPYAYRMAVGSQLEFKGRQKHTYFDAISELEDESGAGVGLQIHRQRLPS